MLGQITRPQISDIKTLLFPSIFSLLSEGQTALMLAMHEKVIKLLLDAGADHAVSDK